MIAGIAGGIIVQYSGLQKETIETITAYVKPVGDIFLRMIFMMVMPLILSALALGVAELGDLKKIGKVGLRTLMYTVIVSAISVIIGIVMVTAFEPGKTISDEDRQMLIERFANSSASLQNMAVSVKSRSIGEIITTLVPRNLFEDLTRAFDPTYTGGGILAIMFFALMMGLALSVSHSEKVDTFKRFLEGLYEVVMKVIGFGMKLAPYGVASLLFSLTATMGFSILVVLSRFVIVVLVALCIHQFITYSLLLKFLGKMSPVYFFKNIKEVMVTAFSTSSSNATLPTAIRVTLENLKLPKDVTHFVLTIGSTANQNGTALYEGITVLFLAQCFGINLELSQQVFVVLLAILGGIGTAGVPSGSLPIIMLILISIGVPGESIAIIYGVDRFLDMCRTVLNVTGDITAAVYVSQLEHGSSS
ncbi:MAG: dicarboxylate/amino acid:cation symporter [Ignavibacteriae bacterium]|nr:dicarboxylate/amino acid:cation symporter [Ignavibacteriota bacterium]